MHEGKQIKRGQPSQKTYYLADMPSPPITNQKFELRMCACCGEFYLVDEHENCFGPVELVAQRDFLGPGEPAEGETG